MTDRELMQMALDALEELRMEHSQNMKVPEEWYSFYHKQETARQALRERLSQPEPEPVVGTKTWFEDGKMVTQHLYAIDIPQKSVDKTAKREHEPVAWMTHTNDLMPLFHMARKSALNWETQPTPLYTAPPKREWVGLTDEDYEELLETKDWGGSLIEATEAKLKEKNT